jgi:FMN-dependent NADH-azoreductase
VPTLDSPRILRVDSSARYGSSVSRQLTTELVGRLSEAHPGSTVIERDLGGGLPSVDETTITAYYTPEAQRTDEQREAIKLSDQLVEELSTTDILVLGAPMYNFTVPAALKAYFDLIARVGVTFSYTDKGPLGLLRDRKTYVVITSNGVEIGSDADFASGYIRHFLGFLGITDVEFIAADQLSFRDDRVTEAKRHIGTLPQEIAA